MALERNRTVLPPEILLEEYRRILAEESRVQALPLVISGYSMTPFLLHGRDTVYLSRLERQPKRGDMLLYRRDSGAYILHRVVRVENGVCTMVGDAQTLLEPGIRRDQIIAIVTAADRKGKRQKPGCFWWEFFEKVWLGMIPLRPYVMAFYGRLRRVLD